MRHAKSIRLFHNPLLEACTHVHPLTPLLLWLPVIFYFIFQSFYLVESSLLFAGYALSGFIFWTLAEYFLHRYLFHFEAKSKIGKYFVYLFHGIHHEDPDDATRLVMPPVPAILMASCLYFIFALFIPANGLKLFFSFFMMGYLCYDYIHFAIHHFPLKKTWWKKIRKNHLIHHARHSTRYGVSSPLWDHIFRTFK